MSAIIVDRDRVETAEGPVDLPIRYWDVSVAELLFPVDIEGARELVAPMDVEPVQTGAGRTLAGLAFFEYRGTSVGPYNEVGLVVAAAPKERPLAGLRAGREALRAARRRQLGFAVVDLPVTTPAANAAGREIWGYPKFVTELPISFGEGRFSAEVLDPDDGSMICAVAGSLGRWVPLPVLDLVTYTRHEDTRWRTVIDARGTYRVHRGADLRLDLGSSQHHMAEHLRTLGLDGARPTIVRATHDWRSLLHKGAADGS